jgi:hypothetical protein
MTTANTSTNASAATNDPTAGDEQKREAVSVPPSTRPQPKPWTKPDDREGWEAIARGRDRRDRPPVGTALFVELTQEQAAWVQEAASAAGVTQVALVRRLIDQARSTDFVGITKGTQEQEATE